MKMIFIYQQADYKAAINVQHGDVILKKPLEDQIHRKSARSDVVM